MSKIIFTLDGSSWQASCARDYPVNDGIEVNVPTDQSEGGQMYAYDKGVAVQSFELAFDKLSAADDTALCNFHANVAVGPKNTFTYTDENSATHTVRWLDLRYPIKRNRQNVYSGTITLRKEL